MKIIDAHMHFSDNPGFCQVALAAKHENTSGHLVQAFKENNIVLGIAMGTRSREELRERIAAFVPQVLVVGEAASAPGNAVQATGDALDAALSI